MMSDLDTTRKQLSRQLAEGIATDPIGVLPVITALQRETDGHLREAVRQAALSSSWSEIATALGVSKQAAHQRFKDYAKGVAGIWTTHAQLPGCAMLRAWSDRCWCSEALLSSVARSC